MELNYTVENKDFLNAAYDGDYKKYYTDMIRDNPFRKIEVFILLGVAAILAIYSLISKTSGLWGIVIIIVLCSILFYIRFPQIMYRRVFLKPLKKSVKHRVATPTKLTLQEDRLIMEQDGMTFQILPKAIEALRWDHLYIYLYILNSDKSNTALELIPQSAFETQGQRQEFIEMLTAYKDSEQEVDKVEETEEK